MTKSELVTKTITVEGTATTSQLVLFEIPYPLSSLEYKLITKNFSNITNLSFTFFIAGVGAAAAPLFETIQSYYHNPDFKFMIKEFICPLIIFLLSLIFLCLSLLLSNDRKKILKKIKLHFKNNPTNKGILKDHE